MQLITFQVTVTPHVYIGQAERLRCSVFTDGNGGMAITGEKDAIFAIVERLVEDRITFSRFVGLEGRIASEGGVISPDSTLEDRVRAEKARTDAKYASRAAERKRGRK